MKKLILLVILNIFITTGLFAHYLWLYVDNYNSLPGKSVKIFIGWGHKFPKDGKPRKEMIKKMKLYLIEPDGNKIPLKLESTGEKGVKPISINLKKQGTYMAVLELKTFVTKTINGYFYKPKNEMENVLESFFYSSTAKAIFNIGKPKGEIYKTKLNNRLELIPLKNPSLLHEGEILPILSLLNGKKNIKSWIYATYDSFSSLKNTFAWATKTNKQGIAEIKILKKGLWLVKTNKTLPYPNSEKADYFKFITTLTFFAK